MSKTIDITLEKTGTSVDVEYQDNLQNEILVSLSRGTGVEVDNVAPFITVDFGSLPQNVYWDEIQDKPSFHEVATSGDYNDLENKPNLHRVATTGNYNDLENKPNLDPVAATGDYDDLSDKPQINGVTLSGNKTAANLHLATDTQGAKADTAYQKPQDGIPSSDLSDAVRTSLGKADTALQEHQSLDGYATEVWVEEQGYLTQHQDISDKEDKSNKVTSWSSTATDTHYPSEKLVKDSLDGKQATIDSSNKLSADLIVDGSTNKTVTATEKSTWSGKQDALVSGTNIKTINNESILGSGNITIEGGGGTGGLLYGGEIDTQTVVQPNTGCYYVAIETGYYSAFGVNVHSDEHVQILIYNGTSWVVNQLQIYNYSYAHGKFETLGDIDDLLDSIVPSSASSSNKLATASDVNGKLSAPATAGTSGQVLTSDGQGGQSWQTPSGGGGTATDVQVNGTSITSNDVANIITEGAYNASTNKIATMSDVPDVSGLAVDSGVVHKTGNEAIEGVKIFNDSASFKDQITLSNRYDSNIHAISVYSRLYNDGQEGIGIFSLLDQVLSGDVIIQGVENPVSSNCAANKLYVDTQVATKYTKPSSGIPASDLASGVIPTVPTISTDISSDATSDTKTASPKAVKTYVDNAIPSVPVTDVTVGGTSVVSSGTAVIPAIPDVTGKADKVSNATSGNFASLDSNGNLADSGHKHSDYLTSHQDISGKEDKTNKVTSLSSSSTDTQYPSAKVVYDQLATKQATLVSGTNIKTVNSTSLLGSGNITINDGVGFQTITTQQDGTMVITLTNGDTITVDLNHTHPNKQDVLVSGTNIKTINNESILGSGNITVSGGSSDAVLYTQQSLTTAQQEQARTNIGAGTYSKPSSGIPSTDIASGVVPNITISSSEPTSGDGENGDIWIVI